MKASKATWMGRGGMALLVLLMAVSLAPANVKVEQAVAEANREFATAFAAQNAEALGALYTEDAVLMTPHGVVTGREAIQQHMSGAMETGMHGLELKTISLDVHGKHALETGSWSAYNADGDQIGSGNYMVMWAQQKGAWKIQKDIINNVESHGDDGE